MKKVLIFYSFLFMVIVIVNITIKKSQKNDLLNNNVAFIKKNTLKQNIRSLRSPSNFKLKNKIQLDCYTLFEKVLDQYKQRYLNERLIKEKKEEYLLLFKLDQFNTAVLGDKVEHYIGYLEALKTQYKLSDQSLQVKSLNKRNLKKLSDIYRSLRLGSDADFNSSFELIESSFFHIYGKNLQFDEILHYDEIKGAMLKRSLLINLTENGLSSLFPKIKTDKKLKKLFNQFVNSGYGKTLGTLLFNLPGLIYGFPPLFLAKSAPIILRPNVFKKLILEGLNSKNFDYFLKEINKNQKYNLTLNLVNRERYHLLRKYYLVGATAFTIAYMSYANHIENLDFETKNKELEPMLRASEAMIKLKESRIDLTKTNDTQASTIVCIEYRLCLNQYNPDLKNLSESHYLEQCSYEQDLPKDNHCID